MADETVGILSVDIVADTTKMLAQTAAAGAAAGTGMGKKMAGGFAAAGVGAALGAALAKSVGAAGAFEQQMSVLAEVTQAGSGQMQRMSDLALQMGADTVFSAGEAADAMLELAKSGITPAQIEAGALSQALNLAATEGIGMADAATIMANAMNTFGIKAKDAQQVSDALAGASAASSASVTDIAQALSQVGPSAVDAGLSIQETAGALASFADAGIKGSDAGTSLKTFLSRLVPQTEAAGGAFKTLGLNVTDQNGNFKSLAAISQELQEGLKGLSDEERTAALNSAFGSDARRAAIVLAKQGADGLREYTKEATKSGSAEKMAAARMEGYQGAMEAFKGSVETLAITFGTMLLPAATAMFEVMAQGVNWFSEHETVAAVLAGVIGGVLVAAVVAYTASMVAAAAATIAATWPVIAVVAAIAALVAAFIWAYNRFEWFKAGVQFVMNAVKVYIEAALRSSAAVWRTLVTVVSAVVSFFRTKVAPVIGAVMKAVVAYFKAASAPIRVALALVWAIVSWLIGKLKGPFLQAVGFVRSFIETNVRAIVQIWRGIQVVYGFVRDVFVKVKDAISGFLEPIIEKVTGFIDRLTQPFQDLAGDMWDIGRDIIEGLWEGIKSMASTLADNISGFIEDNVPGPVLSVLDMNSPSKVFHEIGVGTALGLQQGIEAGSGGVRKAAEGMVPTRVGALGYEASRGGFSGPGRGGVRVFIGERELTDIVRVEVGQDRKRTQFAAAYGRV